jgi:hypothetical protein
MSTLPFSAAMTNPDPLAFQVGPSTLRNTVARFTAVTVSGTIASCAGAIEAMKRRPAASGSVRIMCAWFVGE